MRPIGQIDRRTERGEMLRYFVEELNRSRTGKFPPVTIKRIAFALTAIPTGDLYALRSKCEDAQRRRGAFGAVFWTEIRPKKDQPGLGGTVRNGTR